MTDKELRKLSRYEILELLLASEKQNAELEKQLDEERKKVSELTEQLNNKNLDIQEAGNIADAVVRLSGIFQNAQETADTYLENIRSLSGRQKQICEEMEAKSTAEAERITSEAKASSSDLLNRTETECSQKQTETEKYCEMLRSTTERECREKKEATASECQELRTITDQYCKNLRSTTESKCLSMENETEEKCRETRETAKAEAESYWSDLTGRLEEFYTAHEGMKEMLTLFDQQPPDIPGGKIE